MKNSIKLMLIAFGAASLTGLTVLPAAADGDTTAGKNNSTCRDVSGNKAQCLTARREGETAAQWQAREAAAQASKLVVLKQEGKPGHSNVTVRNPQGHEIRITTTPEGRIVSECCDGPNRVSGSGAFSRLSNGWADTHPGNGGSGGSGSGSHVTRGSR
jgi:hypothetical protein